MIFDRISSGYAATTMKLSPARHGKQKTHPTVPGWVLSWFYWATVVLATLVVVFLADAFPALKVFPATWRISIVDPVNGMVRWVRDNLYQFAELPGGYALGAGPLSDFIVISILNPLRGFLLHVPWFVVALGFGPGIGRARRMQVPDPALQHEVMIDHYMTEWLGRHGVEEVILACGFLPDEMKQVLGDGEPGGPRLRYVVEEEALGTATQKRQSSL